MSELEAGWFAGQLPVRIAAALAKQDAKEALEARRAEEAREERAEEWAQRNMAMAREAAEARGELVSALDVATGHVTGRSIRDIFASAIAAADASDRVAAARASREGTGRVHVEYVADPVLHTGRGEVGLAIFHRARHFADRVRARRAADAAEMDEANRIPLARPVQLNREREPQAPAYLDGRPLR
jgi:hypothetical protein